MKKLILIIVLVGFVSFHSLQAQDKSKAILTNEIDSLSYSLGLLIGNNLFVQGVEEIHPEIYQIGLEDGFSSNPLNMTFEQANLFVQNYFEEKMKMKADENLKEGLAFLAENSKQEGVVVLNNGLQYKVLKAGEGPSPKTGDQVRVHYRGSLLDGSEFDSSYERGEPAVFGIDQVIKGWTEALQLMNTGSHWMLYIPPELAYGSQGAGDVIGPNSTLIFEVELLEIISNE